MVYKVVEDASHEGPRTKTSAYHFLNIGDGLTKMEAGDIVGGAMSLHASVQLQSKDTVWGSKTVDSTAEATLKNIEWKYVDGSAWIPLPAGSIRLKCIEP